MECVAYMRVSTEKQAEEGNGLDSQRRDIENYCRKNELVITDWYIDDGYTGANMDRPELQRLVSDCERMRDLDRASRGRMYYTETEPIHKDGGMRDSREGKAGMMRKGYMETKEMHKGTTPQDKEANMHSLESYLKELSEDLTELLPYMIPEERQMAKTRITTLAAKM